MPNTISEGVIALSCPGWIVVENVSPCLWVFLPRLIASIRNFLRIEEPRMSLLHMEARALVSLLLEVDILDIWEINFDETSHACEFDFFKGINACYQCRKEGHI